MHDVEIFGNGLIIAIHAQRFRTLLLFNQFNDSLSIVVDVDISHGIKDFDLKKKRKRKERNRETITLQL